MERVKPPHVDTDQSIAPATTEYWVRRGRFERKPFSHDVMKRARVERSAYQHALIRRFVRFIAARAGFSRPAEVSSPASSAKVPRT